MTVDGLHFDPLVIDLERAVNELQALAGGNASLWSRGRPGKWTAGQHAQHLVLCLAWTADAYEENERALRRGALAPVPRRGTLQRLWVGLVAGRGLLPRGGRTGRQFEAGAHPERVATFERLRREAERHAALGGRLSPAERDRLWAPNPFLPRWHYTLPEIVRVHAVHVRHHAKQIAEIG